jgi:hypothetical protein
VSEGSRGSRGRTKELALPHFTAFEGKGAERRLFGVRLGGHLRSRFNGNVTNEVRRVVIIVLL